MPPNDWYLFPPLKKHIGGHKFENDQQVVEAVDGWFKSQPKVCFVRTALRNFKELQACYEKCTNKNENYVKKLYGKVV